MGIYVHIPFCASFCTYCGFYSEVCRHQPAHSAYIEALKREIALRKDFFCSSGPVRTLYFGGGTPSLLAPELMADICDALRAGFDLSQLEEFTVEVNPEDVVSAGGGAMLEGFKKLGVNRISMGVQSFCDQHLRFMNRRHTAASAVEAFRKLRAAGFGNISIDLIFGFAGLTDAEWRSTLGQAVALGPEHISAYQMSLDPDSALADMAAAGKYAEPADEACAAQYAMLQECLEQHGWHQYEISNFAREGFCSRHNSAYWTRRPYLGLGAAAHSFDGDALRSWNPASIEEYMKAPGVPEGSETLSASDIFNEQVMLGLRTVRGVEKKTIEAAPYVKGRPLSETAAGMVADGLLEESGSCYRIPRSRLFVCDSIIERLFTD